ncbi:hypothetical protein [Streptomyces sp. NPDC014995]|uniref:hypothetical protein n=1 Tax=Streptomyces sp. NPDC014995 TaxID=3364936 RepID=UPI0036FE7955
MPKNPVRRAGSSGQVEVRPGSPAVFFLALGLSVDPGDPLPALPAGAALALVTAVTEVAQEGTPPATLGDGRGFQAGRTLGDGRGSGGGRRPPGSRRLGRDGAGRRGRLRAGTALIARGEFSVVIVGLAGPAQGRLGALVTTYVMILAVCGPLLTRVASAPRRRRRRRHEAVGRRTRSDASAPRTTATG